MRESLNNLSVGCVSDWSQSTFHPIITLRNRPVLWIRTTQVPVIFLGDLLSTFGQKLTNKCDFPVVSPGLMSQSHNDPHKNAVLTIWAISCGLLNALVKKYYDSKKSSLSGLGQSYVSI